MSKLAEFPVALPPDEEIAEIVPRWVAAEVEIDKSLPEAFSTLRQSILTAAFRGELVQ